MKTITGYKTRNIDKWQFAWLFLCVMLLIISNLSLANNTASSTHYIERGDEWVRPYLSYESLDELFKSIRENIHYEPYRGILRGAIGTAISGRGNALDQSLLLKHILTLQGYQVRLATGVLEPDNAQILLRGMYPPYIPKFNFSAELEPFKLIQQKELIKTISQHYWLEVFQGNNEWLPLDPSFPRANIGESYAKVSSYIEQFDEKISQVVVLQLKQKIGNTKTRTLFDLELPVNEVGYMPITLSSTGMPLRKPDKDSGIKGNATGLFGNSLSKQQKTPVKSSEQKVERPVEATLYNWQLHIPGHGFRKANHTVIHSDAKSAITKEWIDIKVKIPGEKDQHIQRVLFDSSRNDFVNQPSSYRRYVINVLPGSVSERLVKSQFNKYRALPLSKWKKILVNSNNDHIQVMAIDDALASNTLHMILMRLSEASDEATDRAAYRNGLAVVRSQPRILIADAELVNNTLQVSVDLRLDKIDIIPFPGIPIESGRLFQMGRGIMQSTAEGQVLQSLTGQATVTTALLMSQAQLQGIPLKVVSSSGMKHFLKTNRPPEAVIELLKSSLKKDKEVIIPEKPVRLADKDRWGWWEFDRESGHIIGVMDNGLHAAIAEYTLSSNKINLDPEMGFVVGMIVGADTTLFAISGLMLKHGQATQAMIKEAEAYLKQILCTSCPKAAASAGGSVSAGAGCYSKSISAEVTAEAKIDFCEKYINGFKCAASMLMNGLAGDTAKVEAKHGTSYELGCKSGGAESSVSTGN